MQITAFKGIFVWLISIKGCKDCENTFAQMESDCVLRFGFKALHVSYKNHFEHMTAKCVFAFPKCLAVFVSGRGLLFMSFDTVMFTNVHVCNLHHKAHFEIFKQHTAYFFLIMEVWLIWNVIFYGSFFTNYRPFA